MNTSYRWSCQACDASNAPAETCVHCGFPAEANAEEIALAKSQGVDAVLLKRETDIKEKAKWLAQPFWRKVGDVVALAMFVMGFILAKFAGPLEYNILGTMLAGLPFIWLWLVHRSQKGRP